MRLLLTLLHRWFGLLIAVFLFIAGLTGAIIAWDHELDGWLAPELYYSPAQQKQLLTPLQLAAQFEAQHPGLMVSFMPLAIEPGGAMSATVSARQTIESAAEKLPYNEVALNPYTGEIQGTRRWGEVSLARENLMPFIYKLHYSLHLPALSSWDIGMLLMGGVAIVWVLDCFIALIIAFPSSVQWRKSFAFRWRSNGHKITFDLHRSGGVWVWLLLLIMAITAVSMNLSQQFMRPLVSVFSTLTPSPTELKNRSPVSQAVFSREAIVALAQTQAQAHSISAPLGGIFYSPLIDMYGVGFYAPGMGHGDGGLGNSWLYFDGTTGAYLGAHIPGQGTAGDIFMQAQFPLHSGRIIGMTGRIMVTVLGLLIAMLSLTGVIIWVRKRNSRRIKLRTLREEVAGSLTV